MGNTCTKGNVVVVQNLGNFRGGWILGYSRGAEIVFCLEIARVGVFWIKFQGAEILCMEMPTGNFGLMSSTRIKNAACHIDKRLLYIKKLVRCAAEIPMIKCVFSVVWSKVSKPRNVFVQMSCAAVLFSVNIQICCYKFFSPNVGFCRQVSSALTDTSWTCNSAWLIYIYNYIYI